MEISIFEIRQNEITECSFSQVSEARTYGVSIEAESVYFSGISLQKNSGLWVFQTPFAVGKGDLEWSFQGNKHQKTFSIAPDPLKLEDRKLWLAMVQDLTKWISNVLGHQGVRGGSVGLDGLNHYLAIEALLPLMEVFQQRLRNLFQSLRERTEYPIEDVSVRNLTPPFDVVAIQSNPKAVAWLSQSQTDDRIPYIRAQRAVQTYNHPVNRYIRWLVERIANRIQNAVEKLQLDEDDTDVGQKWRATRASLLKKVATTLRRELLISPLANVKPQPISDASLLVVINDPLYGSVHQMGRLLTSGAFRILEDDFAVSFNTSFQIYEVWCFREVIRQLEQIIGVQAMYQGMSKDKLRQNAIAIFQRDDLYLEVAYNPNFAAYWTRGEQKQYSLIGEQRPDITIRIQKGSTRSWMVLDAKYRTTQKNLLASFSSAFSYRQSLIDHEWGGLPTSCFVLAPKMMETGKRTDYWFTLSFLKEHHFGAFLCRPTFDTNNEIAEFIVGSFES